MAQDRTEFPEFVIPVECDIGKNCWIVNYVDVDESEDALDFTCAYKSYDDHKGTDFALRSMAEMNEGVNVQAAATGVVLRMRDGQPDAVKSEEDIEAVKDAGKECGNGVLIDHSPTGYPGLQTMYCHLKKGSIRVKSGDVVTPGQVIAQIGHSGLTQFPHLHFGITYKGDVIDPFTGAKAKDGCKQPGEPLWRDRLSYEPINIYHGGFRTQPPDFKSIEQGEANPTELSAASDAFVFWTAMYGIQKDDHIEMIVKDPKGRTFVTREINQEKNRARQYYYTGRNLKGRPLEKGTYQGYVQIKRNGEVIAKDVREIQVY